MHTSKKSFTRAPQHLNLFLDESCLFDFYFNLRTVSLNFNFQLMKLNTLNAISPVDGRYRGKTKNLSPFFSEEALIKYRVRVEIEYFIALCELPLPQLKSFNPSLFEELRSIYHAFARIQSLVDRDEAFLLNFNQKSLIYSLGFFKLFTPFHLKKIYDF